MKFDAASNIGYDVKARGLDDVHMFSTQKKTEKNSEYDFRDMPPILSFKHAGQTDNVGGFNA